MLEHLYGTQPLINYHFLLRVDAVTDVACKKVEAFANEAEFEYLQEGGVNGYVHMLQKPTTAPKILQIECYANNNLTSTFTVGSRKTLPIILYVSKQANNIDTNYAKQFIFTGCVIKKKTNGALDAEQGGLITDIVEIAFETVTVVNNPTAEQSSEWGFTGKYMDGNNKKSATYNQTEVRKEKMNDRKEYRKWEFDGNNPKGKGTQSAQSVVKMNF